MIAIPNKHNHDTRKNVGPPFLVPGSDGRPLQVGYDDVEIMHLSENNLFELESEKSDIDSLYVALHRRKQSSESLGELIPVLEKDKVYVRQVLCIITASTMGEAISILNRESAPRYWLPLNDDPTNQQIGVERNPYDCRPVWLSRIRKDCIFRSKIDVG